MISNIEISAIGTAVPEPHYDQMEIVEFLASALGLNPAEKRRLSSIHRATGIKKRHTVLEDHLKEKGNYQFFPNNDSQALPSTSQRMTLFKNTALPLALKAIQNCFENYRTFQHKPDNLQNKMKAPLENISHLITVSCTGMYAPGLDIDIIHHLNLPTTVHRICVNFMGCYGAFNALKTAHAICQANAEAKVLVVCLELCSLHYQYPNSQDNILSTSIFSDGAGAVLVENLSKKISDTDSSSANSLKILDFYCDILPESHKAMAWSISDFGFDIVLSSFVPSLIKSGIDHFFKRFLQRKALNFKDIQYYAIHPGGIKILEAVEQALDLNKEANRFSYEIFKNFGNMSSVTILFVLERLWQDLNMKSMVEYKKEISETKSGRNTGTIKNAITSSENILCCAFGPGLTLESMLLSYNPIL